jgi:putative transposase
MLKSKLMNETVGLQITKCVKQSYRFGDRQLFDDFHWMVNEAIHIGLESKLTSRLGLRNLVYDSFKNGYNTSFINMAVFKAHAILKNYRRTIKKRGHCNKPYVKKKFIIVDSCNVKLTGQYIHFSTKPRQFTAIKLNEYALSKLSQNNVKIGTLVIREDEVIIPYSFSVEEKHTEGYIGIDMNFENITSYDTDYTTTVHDISRIVNYKQKVRDRLSHFTRNDHRIRKQLTQKYGKKQRNREHNFLHNLANKITSQNKVPVLEKLKYIRIQGRKGDKKGKRFRFKLNSWSRFKLQNIIDYKSRQNGIVPVYVNPKGTSSKCSICEAKITLEENRMMKCSACGIVLDRDVNASRNILKRGFWSKPVAPSGEGMKQLKDANQMMVSQLVAETPIS